MHIYVRFEIKYICMYIYTFLTVYIYIYFLKVYVTTLVEAFKILREIIEEIY